MYSSGFKDGYNGKILLIHDMKDPSNPNLSVMVGLRVKKKVKSIHGIIL